MDRPLVEFGFNSSGSPVAWCRTGTGPPLMITNNPIFSHLDREWDVAAMRSFYERLAQCFTVVRFNHSGLGMSPLGSAGPIATGPNEFCDDFDAVLAAADVGPVALLGSGVHSQMAMWFAATRSEQVSKLVLFNPVIESAIETERRLAGSRSFAALMRAGKSWTRL